MRSIHQLIPFFFNFILQLHLLKFIYYNFLSFWVFSECSPTSAIWTSRLIKLFLPFLFLRTILIFRLSFPLSLRLFRQKHILFWYLVLFDVIYHDIPPTNILPIQVINRQYCTSLVFICKKAEPKAFARLLIPCESTVNHFAELASHSNDIAFVHAVVKPLDRDVSTLLVVTVPACTLRR